MEVIHQNLTVVVAGSIPTIGELHVVGPGACKKALFDCLATNVNWETFTFTSTGVENRHSAVYRLPQPYCLLSHFYPCQILCKNWLLFEMWLLRKFCPFLFIVSFHHWQVSHLLSSWYSRLSFRRPRHSSTWKQPCQRYSELPSSLRCCDKSVAIWDEPGVSIFPHASRWTNTFCTRWVCQTFAFGRSLGGLFVRISILITWLGPVLSGFLVFFRIQ